MKAILQQIARQHQINLTDIKSLSGGDINEVFLLKCSSENYVIKLNNATKFPGMFEAEAKGLYLLEQTHSFMIPSVHASGYYKDRSYLIMEYIAPGSPASNFWILFAENLTVLHKTTHPHFGLDHDNYIGSLPQTNSKEKSASDFYINYRLEPQLKRAIDNNYEFTKLSGFFKTVSEIIPDEAPSLIHGDLWSGNYLTSEKGAPVLIDPAVVFAPREMDLAMMQLFGGFSSEVFSAYNEMFPLMEDWNDRIPLWQLYYLLVHLNLFGAGYLSQVKTIIKKYS